MRIPPNSSDRFFILPVSCRAFSAAWLASLWVTFSFLAPAGADTIVFPDPYGTNLVTAFETVVDLTTNSAWIITDWGVWSNSCAQVDEALTYISGEVSSTIDDLYYVSADLRAVASDLDYAELYYQADRVLADADIVDTRIDSLNSALYWVDEARSGFESMVELVQQTNVITSVSVGVDPLTYVSGSGGCLCPDYTDLLTLLQSTLRTFYEAQFQYLYSISRGLLLEMFGSASSTSGVSFGRELGDHLRSLFSLWQGASFNLALADEDFEGYGQRLAELGYTLSLVQQGDEENLRYYNVASNLYAHLIDGWCFPTNIEERPLWVTFDQDALRGLLDDVLDNARIRVSVTNALRVSVTNELQVAVTNDIHVVTDVSQEISQIQNNMTEIEDLAGDLHVDEVAEITDTIDDRTHLFDGWDARIRQFPERFESLWNTQYELPDQIIVYGGYSATVRSGGLDGWHGSSGAGSRRSRALGQQEEILTMPSLVLDIGPEADTASGRWIYRVATACHNVTNVIWSLLFLAILVRLFKIDIFLLRSSCFIFLAWLSALGVGGMRRLSIMEAMAESFDRIAKLFTSMFGDGGEDAA